VGKPLAISSEISMAVNPMMESVMSAGVHGMNMALTGARSAAMEVAQLNETTAAGARPEPAGSDVEGLTDALTSLKLYERQVQASAKVVETADEMIGFLLDVHA
jgi:hypothetical protein